MLSSSRSFIKRFYLAINLFYVGKKKPSTIPRDCRGRLTNIGVNSLEIPTECYFAPTGCGIPVERLEIFVPLRSFFYWNVDA